MKYPPFSENQNLHSGKSLKLATATDACRFAFAYVARTEGHLGVFFAAENEMSLRAAIRRARNELD
jgi:hypothetical protein